MIQALLNDGYGPWPDPWAENGTAETISRELGFTGIKLVDATQNTLPMYDYIVPKKHTNQQDPGDPAARSALLLRWLHRNGGLKYEYLSGMK